MAIGAGTWAIGIPSTLFVVLLGFLLALALARTFQASAMRVSALYFWHSLFCVISVWLGRADEYSDARRYYVTSLSPNIAPELGSTAVSYIASLFSQPFGLPFLPVCMIFSMFGFVGLLAFDSALRGVSEGKSRAVRQTGTLLVFLPSLSFWTASIGKDGIAFMAVGLALWSSVRQRGRLPLAVIAIAALILVRPHMGFLMALAMAAAHYWDRKAPGLQRFFVLAGSLAFLGLVLPVVLDYAGMGSDVSPDTFLSYIERRQVMYLDTNAAVDISQMGLLMRLFTYLFRPHVFEAQNFLALLTAVENFLLLTVFLTAVVARVRNVSWKNPVVLKSSRRFEIFYSIAGCLLLSTVTSNLGIAARQKWMVLPVVSVLMISALGRTNGMSAAGLIRRKTRQRRKVRVL